MRTIWEETKTRTRQVGDSFELRALVIIVIVLLGMGLAEMIGR